MRALFFLLAALALIFTFSCKKKNFSEKTNEQTYLSNKHDGDEEIPDSVDPFVPNLIDIPTDDISLYTPPSISSLTLNEDMLYFDDTTAFFNTMAALVNHSDSAIDEWEGDLNFTSLRYLNELDTIVEIEDLEARIPDKYFESVLNEDFALRIDDSIYVFFEEDNYCAIYSISGEDTIHRNFSSSREGCSNNRFKYVKCHDYPYESTGFSWILVTQKWNRSYGLYASIGFRNKVFVVWRWSQSKPLVKMSSREYINVTTDPWHDIIWKINKKTPWYYHEDGKWWMKRKYQKHLVEHIVDFQTGLFVNDFCVSDFERIHNYMEGTDYHYLNDKHDNDLGNSYCIW